MAKKSSEGYKKSIRNRGEDIGYPQAPRAGYSYMPEDQYTDRSQQRAIRRHETRNRYEDMYKLEQMRNERAFDRVSSMENEFYAGVDPRRRKELADGGMVREDHHAMANLPRQAIHCEYPQSYFYQTPYIADLVLGTDTQNDDDGSSMARYLNPLKSAKTPY